MAILLHVIVPIFLVAFSMLAAIMALFAAHFGKGKNHELWMLVIPLCFLLVFFAAWMWAS